MNGNYENTLEPHRGEFYLHSVHLCNTKNVNNDISYKLVQSNLKK